MGGSGPLPSSNPPAPSNRQTPSPFIVGIRFYPVTKVYHFDATGHDDLRVGDFVIVETSRGRQMGQVVSIGPPKEPVGTPFKPIERRATGRDLALRQHLANKAERALETARQIAQEMGLSIKLILAEYSLDGKQLTLSYGSEGKVDTKAFHRRLNRSLRVQVTLRQLGPRDVAKVTGEYGACGEPRCCALFLTEFSPISIRMAKEQGVSLNPTEITGMCGRLRCCLLYEYEQYVEARQRLPKKKTMVGTPYGEGKVVDLLPLKDAAIVQVEDKLYEVPRKDLQPLEELRALEAKAAAPCGRGGPCGQGKEAKAQPAEAGQAEPADKGPPPTPEPEPKAADYDEVLQALNGGSGTRLRRIGADSLVLSAAVPVQR
ncbi:MAG: hypothetical protein D6759_11325, partial [Chloroflexi bacterium]